jgi:putative phosphoribosyl transferase
LRAAEDIVVHAGGVKLDGSLSVPRHAGGIVLFAHRGGSSRYSPRNAYVADALHDAGLATLLLSLLTPREEQEDRFTYRLRFDVTLLARRLILATDWLRACSMTRYLPVGYFGASTGAAAAMLAAAQKPRDVLAIVSRGGRPDLAGSALRRVRAPTLFLVGGADELVLELNQAVYDMLGAEKELRVVDGAGHLFEEPGALDEVARLTTRWLTRHLGASASASASART